jgi:uncharacterized protein
MTVLRTLNREPGITEKLAFLRNPRSYAHGPPRVDIYETHMSYVFIAGTIVFKLKKPVRFPYLDFSTLERREAACRAELRLNRRLARAVYREVLPLMWSRCGFSLGGEGKVVDWLVVMERLDHALMLDRLIAESHVGAAEIDQVSEKLIRFYRTARRALISPTALQARWRHDIEVNFRILLEQRLGMPAGIVRQIARAQRRYLNMRSAVFDARIRRRWIVDAHGDLRPEHIWLGRPVEIIDCLEFDRRLRLVDPFDEIAHLDVECERLGAAWVGERIRRNFAQRLHDGVPEGLYRFYRCYRAVLRARLAIAHLLEPKPRTPEKWPGLARAYLRIAHAEAICIEELLRARGDRRGSGLHAGGGLLLRSTRPREG